jgi:hypothetical protein
VQGQLVNEVWRKKIVQHNAEQKLALISVADMEGVINDYKSDANCHSIS